MIDGYSGCLKCPLFSRPPVFGFGPQTSKIMIIGEAPGKTEVQERRPFVGKSGQLLRQSLKLVNIDPQSVRITNTVICHPEGNATPNTTMIAQCRERLLEEIRETCPDKILLLGGTAVSLMGWKSVVRARGLGSWLELEGKRIYVVATYHPAAVLRSPDLFRDFIFDLQKFSSHNEPITHLLPSLLPLPETVQEINAYMEWLKGASVVSCDLESTGVEPTRDRITAIGFGVMTEGQGPVAVIIPYEMIEASKEAIIDFVRTFPGKLVFHNIKFDMSFLRVWSGDETLTPVCPKDTLMMVYALDERGSSNENSGMAYFTAGLKDQSRLRYDIPDYHFDFDEFLSLPDGEKPWWPLYAYLAIDVSVTVKLYLDLESELEGESEKLMPLVDRLLVPGALAFGLIETRGFFVDVPYLKELEVSLSEEIQKIRLDLDYRARSAGWDKDDFNPGSHKQIAELAQLWKFTPTSFEKEVLQVEIELGAWPQDCKEFFRTLLEYRQKDKVLGTYVKGILKRVDGNGRLHSDFLLHGTDTGRLSCIAQGTMIEIVRDVSKFPQGIPIEDVKVGDLAYSYTDDGDLVIRPVTATLYQGTKKVCRVHWRSSYGREGFVDLTPDHKVRLSSNEWRRSDELRPGDSLLSMGRSEDYLFPTGGEIFLDHRFVASQVVGDVTGKVVHHRDGNHYNNVPSNLEILSDSAHKSYHARLAQDEGRSSYRSRPLESHPGWLNLSRETIWMSLEASGWSVLGAAMALGYDFNSFKGHVIRAGFDIEELKKKNREGRRDQILASAKNARDAYSRQARERNNHKVVRVEILEGEVPVYDLTIDGTWKMIANEICIANCRNPNLQNIPALMGPMIKRAFIAPEGWELWNCDFKQMELRVAAYFSRDENMIKAFRDGIDIHRWVASLMFHCTIDQVTSLQRYLAKYVDFGLLYGRSARGLLEGMEAVYILQTTGKAMTTKEADDLQAAFFNGFPQLRGYIESQHQFVVKNQYVETPTGRRRRFPYIDRQTMGSVQRKSVNTPIQSLASDMTLNAIIKLTDYLDPREAYIVSSVHDSIMLQVREDCRERLKPRIYETMKTPVIPEFDIPLDVDIEIGPNWAEVK